MARIEWDGDLPDNLAAFPDRVDSAMTALMSREARLTERYMKDNAPWNDQTGNARASLSASPEHTGQLQHAIVLSHGMPYGIWLEVRWGGRLAIIIPTLQTRGREVMRDIRMLLEMM
jgi:hypothetical protein